MGKKTMSRRERVITALEHREPDRVPLDMSITVPAYQALKKHMGIDLQEDLYPGHWTDVPIHPEVADKFGLDIVWLRMSGGKSAKPFDLENPPDKRVDGWGIEWTRIDQDPGLYYYEMSKHPLADVTIEDLDDYPWPDPYDSKHTEGLHDYLKYIHEETDFAILTKFGGAMFETAWYLRGMEKFFMDLVNNKPFVQKLLEKIYYVQKGLDEVGIAAAGEYVDILRLSGEDLGTQEAPLISMRMFREQLKPWLHKL
jgi:uroporphyrinogen decarboxylase